MMMIISLVMVLAVVSASSMLLVTPMINPIGQTLQQQQYDDICLIVVANIKQIDIIKIIY
jgi:hypothetical protein